METPFAKRRAGRSDRDVGEVTGGADAGSATFNGSAETGACAPREAAPAYTSSVEQAVESGRDLWGSKLLHASGGPSYGRHVEPNVFQ